MVQQITQLREHLSAITANENVGIACVRMVRRILRNLSRNLEICAKLTVNLERARGGDVRIFSAFAIEGVRMSVEEVLSLQIDDRRGVGEQQLLLLLLELQEAVRGGAREFAGCGCELLLVLNLNLRRLQQHLRGRSGDDSRGSRLRRSHQLLPLHGAVLCADRGKERRGVVAANRRKIRREKLVKSKTDFLEARNSELVKVKWKFLERHFRRNNLISSFMNRKTSLDCRSRKKFSTSSSSLPLSLIR